MPGPLPRVTNRPEFDYRISPDQRTHSSYRVTGNAVAMGEAAGCLAGAAAADGLPPAQICWERYQEIFGRVSSGHSA